MVERRAWPLSVTCRDARSLSGTRRRTRRGARHAQLLEVVDALLEAGQRESRLHDLAHRRSLAAQRGVSSDVRSLIATAFSLQATSLLGYRVELYRCLVPGKSITSDAAKTGARLSVLRGGVTHRLRRLGPERSPLAPEVPAPCSTSHVRPC
ncbi:MAG: DNA repair protein RecO C-terminal domain-containing protein [Candidatus Andersenbacteria bacterium]